MMCRPAAAAFSAVRTTGLAFASSSSSSKDWRSKTNFYKDWWNKDAFGEVRKTKTKAAAKKSGKEVLPAENRSESAKKAEKTAVVTSSSSSNQVSNGNSAFWVGLHHRRDAERKARGKAKNIYEDGGGGETVASGDLFGAIASATAELEVERAEEAAAKSQKGLPPPPTKRTPAKKAPVTTKRKMEEKAKVEEDFVSFPLDNPSKPDLTESAAAALDPEEVRKELLELKRAVAQYR